MKAYARINDGVVAERIDPMTDADGNEIPIENRFHPEFVALLVEIPEGENVQQQWTYDGTTFSAPAPATATADEIRASYEAAAQAMLDNFAKTWGYDSLGRAVGYINSKNAKYKAEGQALSDWRDDVWTASEAIDQAVRNGGEPPANVDAYLAQLPEPPERPIV